MPNELPLPYNHTTADRVAELAKSGQELYLCNKEAFAALSSLKDISNLNIKLDTSFISSLSYIPDNIKNLHLNIEGYFPTVHNPQLKMALEGKECAKSYSVNNKQPSLTDLSKVTIERRLSNIANHITL